MKEKNIIMLDIENEDQISNLFILFKQYKLSSYLQILLNNHFNYYIKKINYYLFYNNLFLVNNFDLPFLAKVNKTSLMNLDKKLSIPCIANDWCPHLIICIGTLILKLLIGINYDLNEQNKLSDNIIDYIKESIKNYDLTIYCNNYHSEESINLTLDKILENWNNYLWNIINTTKKLNYNTNKIYKQNCLHPTKCYKLFLTGNCNFKHTCEASVISSEVKSLNLKEFFIFINIINLK